MDYKKILEGVVDIINTAEKSDIGFANICTYIGENCPELKKSEGEKIRKALLEMVHDTTGDSLWVDYNVHKEDALAWLEKQGEQKSFDYENANIQQKDFAPKVEPKFKVGDWVVSDDKDVHDDYRVCKITKIVDGRYYIEGGDFISESSLAQYEYRLWTIQDAKDGDVLACPLPKGYEVREQIFIFKGINSRDYVENCIEYYCRICDGVFYVNENGYMGTTSSPLYPATKEQRDLLFQKMKEAGYEWDAEKKELKLLITNGGDFESENCEQKPANEEMIETLRTEYEKGRADAIAEMQKEWSEDDKLVVEDIEEAVINYWHGQSQEDLLDWLKSLKDKVQPQPKQEWSEEDIFKVQRICMYLDEAKKYNADITEVRECIDWLKSLKERLKGE